MAVRTPGEQSERGWGCNLCRKRKENGKGRDILTGSRDFSTQSIQNRQHSSSRKEGKEKETESHVKKGNQSCDTIMNEESKPTRNPILSLLPHLFRPESGRPCARPPHGHHLLEEQAIHSGSRLWALSVAAQKMRERKRNILKEEKQK